MTKLEELISTAVEMRSRAYSPYSRFTVGAALECADGTVFTGCNIENAAYSPTLCAERVALGKAVSEGHTSFRRIAVAGGGPRPCVPCGVCRQMLLEFSPDMEVICIGECDNILTTTLRELLPHSFDSTFLSE